MPDETLHGVDLRELFNRAMDSRTMRAALGDRLDYVRRTTRIEVKATTRGSYGSAWGWWMREAHNRARSFKAERRAAKRARWITVDEPAPLPILAAEDYATGKGNGSEITMRASCRDRVQVVKTFLHEVCHLVPVGFRGSRIPFHGREFYSLLADLLQKLYPESDAREVYESKRWRMYAYDRAMVVRFRERGIDYLPGERPIEVEFSPRSIPSAGILPSGIWVCDLGDALDVVREAESAGWTVETFPVSRRAVLRPPTT